MDVRTAQTQIEQAIQQAAPEDGWYLSGWVVVAEWVPPEGQRVLSRIHSPGLTPWAQSGFLYDALEGEGYDEES